MSSADFMWRYCPKSFRTIRVPSTIAASLLNATSRGRWTQPQSGLMTSRSAGTIFERAPDAVGDQRRRFDFLRLHVDDAEAERERHLELPNSSRSSSPRRANSSDSACTFASSIVGNRYR